jgi:glycosyltransferase involved in cell wall biosynthesis
MSSASIYYAADGYLTQRERLMGRHAAGEGFLNAFFATEPTSHFECCAANKAAAGGFLKLARQVRPEATVGWFGHDGLAQAARTGTLYLPAPSLADQAWLRAAGEPGAFSLCGVTHTISSDRVMDELREMLTAPVEPWDALICTSTVVRSSIERLLRERAEWLHRRLGATRMVMPQLPVIPLGVDTVSYRPKPLARTDWRARLGIAENDVALLFVGRLSYHAKAHPGQMFEAAQALARSLEPGRRVHFILAGWYANDAIAEAFRAGAQSLCPSVQLHEVDGRTADARFDVWSAADIFFSLSDNYQETFGLTPLEAAACGLPAVVSDWNGYRDTVIEGRTGFRVRTWAPPPGTMGDLANAYHAGTMNYDHYIGHTCLPVSVDMRECVERLVALGNSAQLRQSMGEAARRHAVENFDWKVIVGRYRELWRELAAIRARLQATAPRPPRLRLPDPTLLFSDYPSRSLAPELRLVSGAAPAAALEMLEAHPLWNFGRSSRLPSDRLKVLVNLAARNGGATVAELLASADGATPVSWRSVGWLIKSGLLQLAPADSDGVGK